MKTLEMKLRVKCGFRILHDDIEHPKGHVEERAGRHSRRRVPRTTSPWKCRSKERTAAQQLQIIGPTYDCQVTSRPVYMASLPSSPTQVLSAERSMAFSGLPPTIWPSHPTAQKVPCAKWNTGFLPPPKRIFTRF